MKKGLVNLIRTTKRKNVVFDPTNIKVINEKEADVLIIPALNQVTVTFTCEDAKQAEEFFNRFAPKV